MGAHYLPLHIIILRYLIALVFTSHFYIHYHHQSLARSLSFVVSSLLDVVFVLQSLESYLCPFFNVENINPFIFREIRVIKAQPLHFTPIPISLLSNISMFKVSESQNLKKNSSN